MPVSVRACAVIRAIQKMRSFRCLSVHNREYPFRLKRPVWLVPEWVWGLCSLHGPQLFVRAQLSPILRITICKILNKQCGKATAVERVLYLPYVIPDLGKLLQKIESRRKRSKSHNIQKHKDSTFISIFICILKSLPYP